MRWPKSALAIQAGNCVLAASDHAKHTTPWLYIAVSEIPRVSWYLGYPKRLA
jgi:hypothetical protein